MSSGIVFQVETTRILKILASEIYDSPLALLRENVQNAYDAIRMRYVPTESLMDGRIDITVNDHEIAVADNGVGMTEQVLTDNFWKAGSSGKQSTEAKKAGVVGTFGIGAMANFGVCQRLAIETRALGCNQTLRSVADRDSLKISERCISLDASPHDRAIGTTVTATLDAQHRITVDQARRYLDPYVALLPVAVYLNSILISQVPMESRLSLNSRQFAALGVVSLHDNTCAASFDTRADQNGQILVWVDDIAFGGVRVDGRACLLQGGGQLMGLRSFFGLAPIPAAGTYQFGGFVNLSLLQPTAGREAISRESTEQVNRLINLAERVASERLALTDAADKNNAFLQWVSTHTKYNLAGRVTIHVLPEDVDVPLGDAKAWVGTKTAHYYTGRDPDILTTFANETSALFQVAQVNPRKAVQLHHLMHILHIPQVPATAQIKKVYSGSELTIAEASVLIRLIAILRDDYLIPNAEAFLADISHGVTVLPKQEGHQLNLYIARSSALLPPLLECYEKAWDVFGSFMKDFVRTRIYHQIQQYVPSSTRGGVDALRKLLQRNRELYRYEEREYGDLTSILGDYLSGGATLTEVLKSARTASRTQTQKVDRDQVGPIEHVFPEVARTPMEEPAEGVGIELMPCPPIMRGDVVTEMKILTTAERYPQLNNFTMLLGLSERLVRTEGDFFRWPHTTRILWGGHRVVYIFTESTGRLSLYYDIELREPLEANQASGGMFPTTTLITQTRIFVPVPDLLTEAFKISGGPKEFYVRFDTLSSDP